MAEREDILAGNYKLLDLLIQNRDDWKERAEYLEALLIQKERAEYLEGLVDFISKAIDKHGDSPTVLQEKMKKFSAVWKTKKNS
jgi:hypothetical protein